MSGLCTRPKAARRPEDSKVGTEIEARSVHGCFAYAYFHCWACAKGSITPQFHLVYDDAFETVFSSADEDEPPDCWSDLVVTSQFRSDMDVEQFGDNSSKAIPGLTDEWLSASERRQVHSTADSEGPTMPLAEGERAIGHATAPMILLCSRMAPDQRSSTRAKWTLTNPPSLIQVTSTIRTRTTL